MKKCFVRLLSRSYLAIVVTILCQGEVNDPIPPLPWTIHNNPYQCCTIKQFHNEHFSLKSKAESRIHLIKVLWGEKGRNPLKNICSGGFTHCQYIDSTMAQPLGNFLFPITDEACWSNNHNPLCHWLSVKTLFQQRPHESN